MLVSSVKTNGFLIRIKTNGSYFFVNVFSPNGGFSSFSFSSLAAAKGYVNFLKSRLSFKQSKSNQLNIFEG